MEQTTFTNPKTFLRHCGTNDLESNQSDEEITGHLKSTVTTISSKHPESKVILSTLLSRKDDLNERTKNINHSLEEIFSASNINVVKHDNIKTEDLRDNKHLNTIGVKRFALNLKRAYFGHSPPNQGCIFLNKLRFSPPPPFFSDLILFPISLLHQPQRPVHNSNNY